MGDILYFNLKFDWKTVVSTFFDLQLPPLTLNIFFCFSDHQTTVLFFFLVLSFHHLPFNAIKKKVIYYQKMTNPIVFPT